MCGNFGLLIVGWVKEKSNESNRVKDEKRMLSPLEILRAQTACTEIRGGQAGGISCFDFGSVDKDPICTRVRCVARKRHPLADDLVKLFEKTAKRKPTSSSTSTFVGHTRFATSSVNTIPELHPHEWVAFHDENVWLMNIATRRFEKSTKQVGVHISHNGDFDELFAYNRIIVNGDVGLWLERVLHCPNSTKGDSPKVAGCMDLFRVQGRWNAAARFAYLKTVLKSPVDVTGGVPLSKQAPNTFPDKSYWAMWGNWFDYFWSQHVNNVIRVVGNDSVPLRYRIDSKGEKQLINELIRAARSFPASASWHKNKVRAFITVTVGGFLRNDAYTAMNEFLGRAEGSFGLQFHSTLEPGVVVIASKGQPMSIGFDPEWNICLTASEADAVSVPVDEQGGWLKCRIDLNSNGEVMRLGSPRLLLEPQAQEVEAPDVEESIDLTLSLTEEYTDPPPSHPLSPHFSEGSHAPLSHRLKKRVSFNDPSSWELTSGIEIRSYYIPDRNEIMRDQLQNRVITINAASNPPDPSSDLVESDLKDVPRVLSAIDNAWARSDSSEFMACQDLSSCLMRCMHLRMRKEVDGMDLIVGGVEASLWVGEQFISDLRTFLPEITAACISTNKLLAVGERNGEKVLNSLMPKKITENTCVIFISQSGQTFPSLHATAKVSKIVKDKLWIVTGCKHSKMEKALNDQCRKLGITVGPRVFDNYSGNRPAEPTSVAIVSTMHTLTRMLLHLCAAALDFNKDKAKADVIPCALTRACVADAKKIVDDTVITNLSDIVGYDINGQTITRRFIKGVECRSVHDELVQQGRRWGEHVSEPWIVLVCVGTYLLVSVGLEMPLFKISAQLVIFIINCLGADLKYDHLGFSPASPQYLTSQPVAWTIVGLVLNIADAVWFIFLAKVFTWMFRWRAGRPLWARHGKRTLVIVDTPCVHQLVEIFVSKLFSQSYGFVGLDVHGASGYDHFVHRFTHRVVRGVLLAVGRPDGRLSCLSGRESNMLLSVKQAAFIQNPSYPPEGSGPDIVTIGHNPFAPNIGLARNVVLRSDTRCSFVDELIYDRLHEAAVPFTGDILRNLSVASDGGAPSSNPVPRSLAHHIYGKHYVQDHIHRLSKSVKSKSNDDERSLSQQNRFHSTNSTKVLPASKDELSVGKKDENGGDDNDDDDGDDIESNVKRPTKSDDPASRVAFCSRLDDVTQDVQNALVCLQQFYDCRVASVERYVAFCVMFHALAKSVHKPWLCVPWDMARSQSNLRIATTASPVAATEAAASHAHVRTRAEQLVVEMLRGYKVHF